MNITVYRLGVGIGDVERMRCQTGSEDSHGGCGGDVFRQTVPDTSSGDWKSSVANVIGSRALSKRSELN